MCDRAPEWGKKTLTKQLPVLLAFLQVHEKVGALLEGPGLRRRKFPSSGSLPFLSSAQRALTCPPPCPAGLRLGAPAGVLRQPLPQVHEHEGVQEEPV